MTPNYTSGLNFKVHRYAGEAIPQHVFMGNFYIT